MSNVLVIACGDTKHDTAGERVAAIDLYRGRQFALARTLAGAGWDVLILSAEHGLIEAGTPVATYQRTMTPDRADALADDDMQAHRLRVWCQDARTVVFYGGALYERVFGALVGRTGLARVGDRREVVNIIGAGCGDHYSVLKQIVAEQTKRRRSVTRRKAPRPGGRRAFRRDMRAWGR